MSALKIERHVVAVAPKLADEGEHPGVDHVEASIDFMGTRSRIARCLGLTAVDANGGGRGAARPRIVWDARPRERAELDD